MACCTRDLASRHDVYITHSHIPESIEVVQVPTYSEYH